jgi:hypothetical protein
MKNLAEAYRGRTGEIFTEMIGFSQCDAEMREAFFVGYLKPRREAAKAALQRGIDQGEFLPNSIWKPLSTRSTGRLSIECSLDTTRSTITSLIPHGG